MANITLSYITPQHFFETVKLLKMTEHRIYLTVDSIEVRFQYDKKEDNQNINQYLLKVQVFATSRIDERSGVSQKTGKDWFIRTQEAYIDLGGQFPVMVKIPLQKDQVPYGVGNYYVHPSSFKVSGYSDLQVADIVLVPADEK